jgi:hypothetical protein
MHAFLFGVEAARVAGGRHERKEEVHRLAPYGGMRGRPHWRQQRMGPAPVTIVH